MYSISSVNSGKYRMFSSALTAAFRGPPLTLQAIANQDLLDSSGSQDDLAAALSVAVIGANACFDPAQLEQTAAHLANFTRFGLNAAGSTPDGYCRLQATKVCGDQRNQFSVGLAVHL